MSGAEVLLMAALAAPAAVAVLAVLAIVLVALAIVVFTLMAFTLAVTDHKAEREGSPWNRNR